MIRLIAAVLTVAVLSTAPNSVWSWPTASRTVVRGFDAPASPYEAGHRGVDIAAAQGEVVVAPADGAVAFVGSVAGRPVVAIDHAGGYRSSIEPVRGIVSTGTIVKAGDPIGIVSGASHCGDQCVHFGVRLDGQYVSPLLVWGLAPRPILLPW